MKDFPHLRGIGFRLVRWLFSHFPDDFRRSYETEFFDLIEAERERLEHQGLLARAVFWPRIVADTMRTGLRLRRGNNGRFDRPMDRRASRRGAEPMQSLIHDARFALRSLRATPVVTLVVILTLGLGVGMNTAIFSAVNAVLLRPLPYANPQTLVSIAASYPTDGVEYAHLAGRDLADVRGNASGFEDIAAVVPIRQNLTGAEVPEQVQVGWVTQNLFDLLGVGAEVGRSFVAEDAPGTAMLSHELWQRGFGGADVLGATIQLDGYPYTVVGVMPNGFRLHQRFLPERFDVWKVPDTWWQNGDFWSSQGVEYGLLRVIGRLQDQESLETARASLATIAEDLRTRVPSYARAGLEFQVDPLHEGVVQDVRGTLLLLFAAVGFVLLIACANVMNLLLVRSQGRAREIVLRMAMGCSRWRVAQLLLVESLVLAALGSAVGLVLGLEGTRLLRALQVTSLPMFDGFTVDANVLAFTAIVCFGCTMLFGVVPAFSASRRNASECLTQSRTTNRSQQRVSRFLVVGQLALSLVLLIGAGLLTISLKSLYDVEPGFEYRNLLNFTVSLPGTRYERPEGTDAFLRRFEDRIEGLPGVLSAGVIWPMPLTGRSWSNTYSAGAVVSDDRAYAGYRVVTPSLFESLDIRIVDGETFGNRDPKRVVIVSESVARNAWPGERAIGKTLSANPWGGGENEFEVVGVVRDVRYSDLRDPPEPTLYFDAKGWSWTDWEMNFAVRTAGSPEAMIPAIRAELEAMDPEIPLASAESMESIVLTRTASNRFALFLIGSFAIVAIVLAGIGLYGVLSYSVNQRRRELGIRLALGSERGNLMKLVLRQGLILAGVGVALGVVGATFLTRFLGAFLVGTTATDVRTYAVVVGVLMSIAGLACYLPARRATRVDPIQVLRAE